MLRISSCKPSESSVMLESARDWIQPVADSGDYIIDNITKLEPSASLALKYK